MSVSSKSQIRIVQCGPAAQKRREAEGQWYEGIFTVFRRYDSSLDMVVADLKKAYELCRNGRDAEEVEDIASYICAVDPGRFVPLNHNRIWVGDYFFLLRAFHRGYETDASWRVSIYSGPTRFMSGEEQEAGEEFNMKELKLLHAEKDLEEHWTQKIES